MEDLEAFLSPEQAREAFDMLDNNGDGKLVLADIRDAVIKIYKERRNLALSLKVSSLPAVSLTDKVCLEHKSNSAYDVFAVLPVTTLLVSCCQDTKTVVGKLELVIGVVLHLIFIFFYLMVFNVSTFLLRNHATAELQLPSPLP